jgi:hypothetical protein
MQNFRQVGGVLAKIGTEQFQSNIDVTACSALPSSHATTQETGKWG